MPMVGRFLNATLVCDLPWASCVSLPVYPMQPSSGNGGADRGANNPGIPLLGGGGVPLAPSWLRGRVSGAKPSAPLLPPPSIPRGGWGSGSTRDPSITLPPIGTPAPL